MVAIKLVCLHRTLVHPFGLINSRVQLYQTQSYCDVVQPKRLVETRLKTNPRARFPGCPLPSDLDILTSETPNDTVTKEDVVALRELREDFIAIC